LESLGQLLFDIHFPRLCPIQFSHLQPDAVNTVVSPWFITSALAVIVNWQGLTTIVLDILQLDTPLELLYQQEAV
jgi:hypothetical protein